MQDETVPSRDSPWLREIGNSGPLLALMAWLTGCALWRTPWAATGTPPVMRLALAAIAAIAGGAILVLAALTPSRSLRPAWICGGLSLWAVAGALFSLLSPNPDATGRADFWLLAHATLLLGTMLIAVASPDPRPFDKIDFSASLLELLAMGGTLAALYWWIVLAPYGGYALINPDAHPHVIGLLWARPLAVVVSALALAVVTIGCIRREIDRLRYTALTAACALLFLAVCRLLWLNGAATPAHGSVPSLALLGLAPIMAAGAVAYFHFAPKPVGFDAIGEISVPAQWMVAFLPALALLASTWNFATGGWTSHHRLPGEAWWATGLIVLLCSRLLLDFVVGLTSGDRADPTWREQMQALQEEVTNRTKQMSTLHSITADLNRTLNTEQVLITALDRMVDVVHADGGAVWLRADVVGMAAGGDEDTGEDTGNLAVLRRDMVRGEAERRSLSSIRSMQEDNSRPSVVESLQSAGQWKLVRWCGEDQEVVRSELLKLHGALEEIGLEECLTQCRDIENAKNVSYMAPMAWKGNVLGGVGIVRCQKPLSKDEKDLLDALALEVGAALQNAQLYQEAIRLTDRDALTDLYNHRAVQNQLNANLARARRMSSEFTVLLMDLNNFKFFNDTYGHAVGDKVLSTVADCLRDCVRTGDVIGRYGGDEFIALLPETGNEGSMNVVRRITERLKRESYQQANDGRRIPIALSFGLAVFPHEAKSVLDLLAAANKKLTDYKIEGESALTSRDDATERREMRLLQEVDEGGSFSVLDALVTAIDNKDHYTRRHSEDVTYWASLMARVLEFPQETQRAVRISGLLHDVGKIAVPDAILRKPGRLADDEFKIMQQHPVFGALIVKDVPNLTEVLGGIRHHHERYDGKGYPDKLAAEDIPMLGRLLAVPDCFSAMTTERPYRRALTWSEAITEIEQGRGTQFDPLMVDAFLEMIATLIQQGEGDTSSKPVAVPAM